MQEVEINASNVPSKKGAKTNLIYNINDKPPFQKTFLAALQMLLAVLAGTIAVPMIVGNGMSQSAALFGAGVGTIIYLVITRFRSPAFLSSSFSFIGATSAAFAGAMSMSVGYLGIVIGSILAGLVYVVLSVLTKFIGTDWIDKVMPPVIIGPVVMILGLVLAPDAISKLFLGNVIDASTALPTANKYLCLAVGLITLFSIIAIASHAKKTLKLIPFLVGIGIGYVVALIFTLIGLASNNVELQIIDFSVFNNIQWYPDFAFLKAIDGIKFLNENNSWGEFGKYVGMIALAYIPVSFVSFAEHIADHKNMSFLTARDLITDPGLSRTVMGDGAASMVGGIIFGCPNTTYSEVVSCLSISRNASTRVPLYTAIMAILISFVGPFITFLSTIPQCVIGGLCIGLYGFISASGLMMLKKVDMTDLRNIFVVSTILVCGVGGLILQFGNVSVSAIAIALVLGILVNQIAKVPSRIEEAKENKNTNNEDENQ